MKSMSSDGCPKFTSTSIGTASDDPIVLRDLTELQKERVVTAIFSGGVSSFLVEFAVSAGSGRSQGFLFAGVGALCGNNNYSINFGKKVSSPLRSRSASRTLNFVDILFLCEKMIFLLMILQD